MFRSKHRKYAVAVGKLNGKDPLDIRNIEFKFIDAGLHCWVADPFPIEYEGELYIFGELLFYKKAKGTIGYTKLTGSGFTTWKEVIEEPYHLSFPNLMKIDGELYMCPESIESKQLYLYKCIVFPDIWEKDVVLCDNCEYSDTIYYKDSWNNYGFTCLWKGIEDHKLGIFKINDKNQCTLSDGNIRMEQFWTSRPAGQIFYSPSLERKIMVSQVCKPQYGCGLAFKKFNLSWPDYTEEVIEQVFPKEICCDVKRDWIGMHTYNISENYAVIDFVYMGFSPVELFYRGYRKLKRIRKEISEK